MIYLDNHSATQPCSASLERMESFLKNHWAASFSPHKMGQELIHALDTRYEILYDFVRAGVLDRFIFTSSGAEGVNQVFWSVFVEKARKEGKTHFIVSEIEDLATLLNAKKMEDLGCTIHFVKVDQNGQIDLEHLKSLINPRTALISIAYANGLTGVIQPVDEIIQIAKEKGALLHLDANYAVGKMPVEFRSDYLTFSGEMIHSVKGSGALFAKESAPLVPFIVGGIEQNGLRGGIFDIPSFIALSAACQQAEIFSDMMALEIVRCRNLLENEVGGKVLFQDALRLPNTTCIAFEGVHQEALLYMLSRKGVYGTIGGHSMQHLSKISEQAISFSLSRMTTEDEIKRASQIIKEEVQKLQGVSVCI